MGRDHFLRLLWHAMKEIRCKESGFSQQFEWNRWLCCGNIGDDSHGERNRNPLLQWHNAPFDLSSTEFESDRERWNGAAMSESATPITRRNEDLK